MYKRQEFIHNVNSGLERPKSCSFHCIKTCDYTKSPYCIIKALYNAAKGNMKKGYAFAGSNAFLAEKISSVKEVMSTLEREFFLATHKDVYKRQMPRFVVLHDKNWRILLFLN